jgi:hypothetical protein
MADLYFSLPRIAPISTNCEWNYLSHYFLKYETVNEEIGTIFYFFFCHELQ